MRKRGAVRCTVIDVDAFEETRAVQILSKIPNDARAYFPVCLFSFLFLFFCGRS